MVASLLQKPVAARHQQPQREQPVRSRHQPSNFEAGAAPPPRIAHAAARARAVKPAGEEMSVRKAVSNYKETRTNEVGAAKGAARTGTRRKESTTKVVRHGMWLHNSMNEVGGKGDGQRQVMVERALNTLTSLNSTLNSWCGVGPSFCLSVVFINIILLL